MEASKCIVIINGQNILCKIIWRRGSRFEIIETDDERYIGTIVDASDVIKCNTS